MIFLDRRWWWIVSTLDINRSVWCRCCDTLDTPDCTVQPNEKVYFSQSVAVRQCLFLCFMSGDHPSNPFRVRYCSLRTSAAQNLNRIRSVVVRYVFVLPCTYPVHVRLYTVGFRYPFGGPADGGYNTASCGTCITYPTARRSSHQKYVIKRRNAPCDWAFHRSYWLALLWIKHSAWR